MQTDNLIKHTSGETAGRDPRKISAEEWQAAGVKGGPILGAIRAKCLDCSCGQPSEVAKCVSINCALWPYRMKTNPFRAARELSDEQRAALADRL